MVKQCIAVVGLNENLQTVDFVHNTDGSGPACHINITQFLLGDF